MRFIYRICICARVLGKKHWNCEAFSTPLDLHLTQPLSPMVVVSFVIVMY